VLRLGVSLCLVLGPPAGSTPLLAGTASLAPSATLVLPNAARKVLEPNGDPQDQVRWVPIHLWQWNPTPGANYSPMGCGAFSVPVALSVYDPLRLGSYAAAHTLYDQMNHIPLLGGTLEGENAAEARRQGYAAPTYYDGTTGDLLTAIDHGPPVILGVDPLLFGIGLHNVLLVGYRVDDQGVLRQLFVDNPALSSPDLEDTPFVAAPGNDVIDGRDLVSQWTGAFTPVFGDEAAAAGWRALVKR
jgi:hypothetical protein